MAVRMGHKLENILWFGGYEGQYELRKETIIWMHSGPFVNLN